MKLIKEKVQGTRPSRPSKNNMCSVRWPKQHPAVHAGRSTYCIIYVIPSIHEGSNQAEHGSLSWGYESSSSSLSRINQKHPPPGTSTPHAYPVLVSSASQRTEIACAQRDQADMDTRASGFGSNTRNSSSVIPTGGRVVSFAILNPAISSSSPCPFSPIM